MPTREQILEKVTDYDIFNHYLKPFHNHGHRLMAGKNFSNPFLTEKQKTPSFNIYQPNNGKEWRFHDFATQDHGSCFDLVMRLFNVSFPECLDMINRDLCLCANQSSEHNCPSSEPCNSDKKFTVKKRPFTPKELEYWKQFGITGDILKKFNVTALDEFSSVSREGKPYTIRSSAEKPIYAYDYGNWMKLYKPFDEKKYRFQHLGVKDQHHLFGLNLIPESGELVFITGGEKDAMTLFAHGFPAFCLNSETASLDKAISADLKNRFRHFMILYDNDTTGMAQSKSLAYNHGLHRVLLPEIPSNGKDISDFFASGGTVETLNKLIAEAVNSPLPETPCDHKVVYTAVELMEMGNIQQQYLLEPILPQIGTAVLAGKPDTGKTQLARQLCIHIAAGLNDFLGFTINPKHGKALYLSTEDSREATTFLLSQSNQWLVN
jgi:hypothetical protein